MSPADLAMICTPSSNQGKQQLGRDVSTRSLGSKGMPSSRQPVQLRDHTDSEPESDDSSQEDSCSGDSWDPLHSGPTTAVQKKSAKAESTRMTLVDMIAREMMEASDVSDLAKGEQSMKDKVREMKSLLEQGKSLARHDRKGGPKPSLRRRPSMNDDSKQYSAKQQKSAAPPTLPQRAREDSRFIAFSKSMPANMPTRKKGELDSPTYARPKYRKMLSEQQPQQQDEAKASRGRNTRLKDWVPTIPVRNSGGRSDEEESMESGDRQPLDVSLETATTSLTLSVSHGVHKDSPQKSLKDTDTSSSHDPERLSADQIEAYVMCRIPSFVRKQMSSDDWKKIFAAAADSQQGSSVRSYSSGRDDWSRTIDSQFSEGKALDDLCTAILKETTPRDSVSFSGARAWSDNGEKNAAPRVPVRHGVPRRSSSPVPERRYDHQPSHNHRASDSCLVVKPKRRNVVFHEVQVREYERILDINPSTSSGPSVGLGWRYQQCEPLSLDELEDNFTDPHSILLRREWREHTVLEWGYSRNDIARAVRESLKIKNQRKQTCNNLRHEKVEYLVEKSTRKVRRLLGFVAGQGGHRRRSSIRSRS
eukprot:Nitzschia sp. Nitz4//scaffold3_size479765//408328//410097//NITZ4_000175-RA/size479765-processed-gene-1.548-mRNA-1//-1//CDS//3329550983//3060//frame0